MSMNFQSNLTHQILHYEVGLQRKTKKSIHLYLFELDFDMEEFSHIIIFLGMEPTKIHLFLHCRAYILFVYI